MIFFDDKTLRWWFRLSSVLRQQYKNKAKLKNRSSLKMLLLKPEPGHWKTLTLKNLDPEKRGPYEIKLRIWSRLLKKSLIENFIFCAVNIHDAVFNFKKSQAKKACNFIEKRLRYMCFPKNFADVLITPIS